MAASTGHSTPEHIPHVTSSDNDQDMDGESESDSTDDYLDAIDGPQLPRVLQFTEVFNIRSFVRHHIASRVKENPAEAAAIVSSVRMVGQEKDGSILFTWVERRQDVEQGERESSHAVDDDDLADAVTTTVAVYTQGKPTFNPLHTFDEEVNIVDASLDPTHSLLAYTTVGSVEGDIVYHTSVAEVCPSMRTFTVEGLRPDRFRKVQYLYPDAPELIQTWQMRAHLMVMVDRTGVLCLAVESQGGQWWQPNFSLVASDSMWYEWDPVRQLLYTAQFEESSSSPGRMDLECREVKLCMSKKGELELNVKVAFSLSLPLSIGADSFLCSSNYFKHPVALSLPSTDLNMKAISQQDRFTCVCLQHPPSDRSYQFLPNASTQSASEMSFTQHMSTDKQAVSYSIYLLHSGHILQGQASIAPSHLQQPRMSFIPLGGLVAVFIPGQMLHLINVGCHGDIPAHHIIADIDFSFVPTLLPSSESHFDAEEMGLFHLSYSPLPCTTAEQASVMLVETDSEIIFSCAFSPSGLFELYCAASSSHQTRLSSLYTALVVQPNERVVGTMLKHLCVTPLGLNTAEHFATFILGSAFFSFSKQERMCFTRLLQSSGQTSSTGVVKKDKGGKRLGQLTVTWLDNLHQQFQSTMEKKPTLANLATVPVQQHVTALWIQSLLSQPSVTRLELLEALQTTQASGPKQKKKSFYKEFFSRKSTNPTFAAAQDLGRSLPDMKFLSPDKDLANSSVLQRQALYHTSFEHFRSVLPESINRKTIQQAAQCYTEELLKYSTKLLTLIWDSLRMPSSGPYHSSLTTAASGEETILFHLLQVYSLVLLQLNVPPPSGFHTLLSSLAFRSVEFSLFLQFVATGAVTLTDHFMEKLIKVGGQGGGLDTSTVMELILSLPQEKQLNFLRQWEHPLATELLERAAGLAAY